LFSNVRVNSFSTIQDSIVLPDASIGRHCRITKAIIEKGCEMPEGTVIGEDKAEDETKYYVSSEGGGTGYSGNAWTKTACCEVRLNLRTLLG